MIPRETTSDLHMAHRYICEVKSNVWQTRLRQKKGELCLEELIKMNDKMEILKIKLAISQNQIKQEIARIMKQVGPND